MTQNIQKTFKFGGVVVKVIDKSSHEDREKRLSDALKNYYKNIEREKDEKR